MNMTRLADGSYTLDEDRSHSRRFDEYYEVEFEFDANDWPMIWKLLVRTLNPNGIRQRTMNDQVVVQAWLLCRELAGLVFSLEDAGYSFRYSVNRGSMTTVNGGTVK